MIYEVMQYCNNFFNLDSGDDVIMTTERVDAGTTIVFRNYNKVLPQSEYLYVSGAFFDGVYEALSVQKQENDLVVGVSDNLAVVTDYGVKMYRLDVPWEFYNIVKAIEKFVADNPRTRLTRESWQGQSYNADLDYTWQKAFNNDLMPYKRLRSATSNTLDMPYQRTTSSPSTGGGSGGTTDHSALTNRNSPDQHPQSAITGLTAALGAKISDAPKDNNKYVRQNGIWVVADAGGGSGGTTDHFALTNRDKADQHPQSAITGLTGAISGLNNRCQALEGSVQTLDTESEALNAAVQTKISDAPKDGSAYNRKDGAWVVAEAGGGGGEGVAHVVAQLKYKGSTGSSTHNWYRVWSDGLVEMGGVIPTLTTAAQRNVDWTSILPAGTTIVNTQKIVFGYRETGTALSTSTTTAQLRDMGYWNVSSTGFSTWCAANLEKSWYAVGFKS